MSGLAVGGQLIAPQLMLEAAWQCESLPRQLPAIRSYDPGAVTICNSSTQN
jgi:hypothetical protein